MGSLTPYVGMMYSFGSYWIVPSKLATVTAYLEKAQQLGVKIAHIQVHVMPGEWYVPDNSWTPAGAGEPMTVAYLHDLISLMHSYDMKVLMYMNTWCDSALANSLYSDCMTAIPAWGGNVFMDLDPDKSYGATVLEQTRNAMDAWGFDGFEIDGFAPNGSPLESTTPKFLDFLNLARIDANSRNKVIMGNPIRSSAVQSYLDFASNALDAPYTNAGPYDLNDCSNRINGHVPWYQMVRDYCKFTNAQLQYFAWEPHNTAEDSYSTTPLSREEWQTFLQWCLKGRVLPAPRWDDFMLDNMWLNKDLFDYYIPQITAVIETMVNPALPFDDDFADLNRWRKTSGTWAVR